MTIPDPTENSDEVVHETDAQAAAEQAAVEQTEAAVATILNELQGVNCVNKLNDGTTLDDVIQIIMQEVILPDEEIMGYDRVADFVSRFTPFASVGDEDGIVKTPEHIAQLVCDLVELSPHSKVLDITCGTGTFLVAAYQAMMNSATTPEQVQDIPNRIFGIDKNIEMWGIARNQLSILGTSSENIVHSDCWDETVVEQVRRFGPDTVIFNPPHGITPTQNKRVFQFLKQACDLCNPNGIVIGLLPVPSLIHKRSGRGAGHIVPDRRLLLQSHTLVATMQLPEHIFKLMPSSADVTNSMPPALVVMKAHRPHRYETDKVWMGMWMKDGKRFKDQFGLVTDERLESAGFTWEAIRERWSFSFRSRDTVPLQAIPWDGREPAFGASHSRLIRLEDDDWIAAAEIPAPEKVDVEFIERVERTWVSYLLHLRIMRKK